MKVWKFQVDIPFIPIDNLVDHQLLISGLSCTFSCEHCHYPELVGDPLRLELSFNFAPEHNTEVIVIGQ